MNKVTFNRRPAPQWVEYRPLYKITKLLLVLSIASRGSKSSLIRLHLFDWCLKDSERMKNLVGWVNNEKLLLERWGIDPAVNQALALASEDGLMVQENNGYRLTNKGEKLVDLAIENKLFANEIEMLRNVGKKVTEGKIEDVTKRWLEID